MPDVTTFLADPPWGRERGGGRVKRGADRHYPLLTVDQIYQTIILSCPAGRQLVGTWDGFFFMWTTSNAELDAHQLGKMLRLRYVTDWVWCKARLMDSLAPVLKVKMGLGQYRRGSHERLLMFVAGRPPMPEKPWPSSVILEWPGEHSEKPAAQYDICEHVGGTHARKMELFARRTRPGWEAWGNQVVDDVNQEEEHHDDATIG